MALEWVSIIEPFPLSDKPILFEDFLLLLPLATKRVAIDIGLSFDFPMKVSAIIESLLTSDIFKYKTKNKVQTTNTLLKRLLIFICNLLNQFTRDVLFNLINQLYDGTQRRKLF